jgi:hypothetical protein
MILAHALVVKPDRDSAGGDEDGNTITHHEGPRVIDFETAIAKQFPP